MLLKDIMTKDVLTLSPNDSLEKAAELFVEHGISGAPVIDAPAKTADQAAVPDAF